MQKEKAPKTWPGWIFWTVASLIFIFSVVVAQELINLHNQPPAPDYRMWTIMNTFNGNGAKNTEQFVVSDHWKLQWFCDPSTDYFGQYNVIIYIKYADGSRQLAVNTICQNGNTQGETDIYTGGTIYLEINGEDAWMIKILELQ